MPVTLPAILVRNERRVIPMTNGQGGTTRAGALAIWVAARERAVDELATRAVRLACEGRESEAVHLRAAARLLQLRALQERAQLAACGRERGGRERPRLRAVAS